MAFDINDLFRAPSGELMLRQAWGAEPVCRSGATSRDAWPVGGVFTAAVDTDPAVLLGYGRWQLLGRRGLVWDWKRTA
jgi:hypothetical protein